MGIFDKFKSGLEKSSSNLTDGLKNIFSKKKIDSTILEEFEELLISSDAGVDVAKELRKDFESLKVDKKLNDHKEILKLLADKFRESDRESFILLQAYMLRTHGNSDFEESSYNAPRPDFSELTQMEALEILGLDQDATENEVLKAHRRLIQRLHPDRGGSDYLAAKINAAKDKLMAS